MASEDLTTAGRPARINFQTEIVNEELSCAKRYRDAVTSGLVSDLFTVRLDDKGQTMLVICLQFTLSKNAKQSILTRSNFVSNCLQVYKMLHLKKINLISY